MDAKNVGRETVSSLGPLSLLVAALAAPLAAQTTQRVSVTSSGTPANRDSQFPSMSADGRYVAFESDATNLVAADTNFSKDVFVRDRQLGSTELISVDSGGAQGNDWSSNPKISGDGRYVTFMSAATNFFAGDTNGDFDVFVRDRQSGTTECVSVDPSGAQACGFSYYMSISADGRYVAFESGASNLVAGDTNGTGDIFVRDRVLGTTELVSVDSTGVQANGVSVYPLISPDGRYVVFTSYASNLVVGDMNGFTDVFVRDRQSGTTQRVSVDSSGAEGNGEVGTGSISADGRYLVFASRASNLVAGDTNGISDIFVRDLQLGSTRRISVAFGAQANGDCFTPSISADGRYAVFESVAFNLVFPDSWNSCDIFVCDLQLDTIERASVTSSGSAANVESYDASISPDGRYVAFFGPSSFDVGDTNHASDVFLRDTLGAPNFTSLCDPGAGGVIACPCANPPSGSGRGCDNSSSTGGAILSAAGGTFVSSDSLIFTTSGEKLTATSVLLQGTSSPASGTVYGQGVRCVGGTLKRLFTKSASGGSITAPDFGAGDTTVSARSAAKGNPISAGQSRWYLVFYRDPIVLGGCPSASTFNATQTGEIAWSP